MSSTHTASRLPAHDGLCGRCRARDAVTAMVVEGGNGDGDGTGLGYGSFAIALPILPAILPLLNAGRG